jgi:hypothetical protein
MSSVPAGTERWRQLPVGVLANRPRQRVSLTTTWGDKVNATVYYAASAKQQLSDAQRTLDTHITSSATGRCIACDIPGPCYKRETAVVIFSRSLRLPQRIPGATHPELIDADVGAISWFGDAGG